MNVKQLLEKWAGCPQYTVEQMIWQEAREGGVDHILESIRVELREDPELRAHAGDIDGPELEREVRRLVEAAMSPDPIGEVD